MPKVLLTLPTYLCGGGGVRKKYAHKTFIGKDPLSPSICAGAIWLTTVGGYMKGRKKSEIEKTVCVL